MEYEEGEDNGVFRVFVSHGQSHLWKDVARYIDKHFEDAETVSLQELPNKGRTVIEKLEDEIDECHFAIIVMTSEDEQISGTKRTRQNVVHEIGFCQGSLGRDKVLVLRQEGVEEFSNISGIVYEPFTGDNIRSTFPRITDEIESAMEDAQKENTDEEESDEEE